MPDPNGVNPGLPVFVGTGGDHRLYVRDLANWWRVLTPTAYCLDNPAAAIVSAHAAGEYVLTVACRGSDNGLYYAQEPVSSGTLPSILPASMQPLGGTLINGPAVAAVDPLGAGSVAAEMTFFGLGTDSHVYTRTVLTGWQPTPWACIGHPAASTELGGNGPEATVFACHGWDGQLWATANTGSGWGPVHPLPSQLIDGPGVAVDPQTVYYDAEGTDGQVWEFNTTQGWFPIGGATHTGAARAALLLAGNNP